MSRLLCALAGLFLLAAPASASLTPFSLMPTPDCVTYAPATWFDRDKPTTCLVVKKKHRHARHKVQRHYVAEKNKPTREMARIQLLREFEQWKAQREFGLDAVRGRSGARETSP